jgi:hypothetical protein
VDWLRKPGGGTNRRPLLKRDIEDAQAHTRSGAEAARYLGVHYDTYRKYAVMYGIHEQHINRGGKGIPKAKARSRHYPLTEILAGKHPTYNIYKLRKRLIRAGYFEEKCSLCGMSERRITDFKTPLMLVFKDQDKRNHRLDNMYLLCFNCVFLTVGELNCVNPYKVEKLSVIDKDGSIGGEDNFDMDTTEIDNIIAEAKAELEKGNQQ